ncbi:heterokaryon incompatibility protein Het-C-domain-containing protein [Russula dissimulans]|nr:heterokaryon incompatibility protein Het-C-domain-containing protein [Russula dissimulans]
MPSTTSNLLFLIAFIALLPLQVNAFGAGDIPDFSYLHNKAFRHGDIENILTEVAKTVGGLATGSGMLQFAQSIMAVGPSGSKFDKGDIKKVYFGNWLRDHSQLSADTLVLIVAVLSFMDFGFATEEFEVTPERLGVYLPVEHIDNPKGYAAKEGDARRFHPKLRPPVQPQELEIDPRTGMKNYMATENRSWDTPTAFIRRTSRGCIEHGRRAGGKEGAELWEAYRNWCEIALRKMGHRQVFCHVSDQVIINTPNGPSPPLVTGTFGGADFLHSLLGEATDRFSQTSVTDLFQKMNDASNADSSSVISTIQSILSKVPHGEGSSQMQQGEQLHVQSKAYHFDPKNIAPPQVRQQLWTLLKWRDGVYRSVTNLIDSVPGLESLIDNLGESLDTLLHRITILPIHADGLQPILKEFISSLGDASKAAIDSADRYEVFNNPHASDPTHSLLSKDHFILILNEPAGKVAQIVVQHSANVVVQAWSDDRANPDQVIDQVLEAFHHPYLNVGRSQIQDEMFRGLEGWLNGLHDREGESVRSRRNKREDSGDEAPGTHTHPESTFRSRGSQQPLAGSAHLSSQGEESRRQASSHQQGATTPRQASYNRNDVYSRPPERYENEGGYRPTDGHVEIYEQRRAYEQQSSGYESHERRGHADYSEGPRYQEQQPRRPYGYAERSEGLRYQEEQPRQPYGHVDLSEGLRDQEEQPHRSHRHEERQQGYGTYPRPDDESRGYDNDRNSYRGGYEHERSERHHHGRHERRGSGESAHYDGQYGGSPNRNREDFGGRSRAYGRDEPSAYTFGFERLNLQGQDADHSGRRGHHGHEKRHDHHDRGHGY